MQTTASTTEIHLKKVGERARLRAIHPNPKLHCGFLSERATYSGH
jgi:hypothetical protein